MRKIDGFTFIEAIIVIFILALIAGIGTPSILAWRSAAKLKGAADNLKGDLELAKLKAIQENNKVAINFKANKYTVFKDDGATQGVHDSSEDLYGSRTLPAGVIIDLVQTGFNDDGLGGKYMRFSGKGTATNGTAYLVNSRGAIKKVIISILGKISIESGDTS
jgi:Tfp pilus assembly protein FimT